MAKRQKAWAKHTRDLLFGVLGQKCAFCGTTEDLEFDVIHPPENNDHHRRMDWSHRMSFYRRMFYANNLQVLCSHCNGRKGNQLVLIHYSQVQQPF